MSTNPTDTLSTKARKGPHNLRELGLYSAGQYAGMRNYAMAMASVRSGSARADLVRAARSFHHVYLARLREAAGADGYRAPDMSIVTDPLPLFQLPTVVAGWLTRKQA